MPDVCLFAVSLGSAAFHWSSRTQHDEHSCNLLKPTAIAHLRTVNPAGPRLIDSKISAHTAQQWRQNTNTTRAWAKKRAKAKSTRGPGPCLHLNKLITHTSFLTVAHLSPLSKCNFIWWSLSCRYPFMSLLCKLQTVVCSEDFKIHLLHLKISGPNLSGTNMHDSKYICRAVPQNVKTTQIPTKPPFGVIKILNEQGDPYSLKTSVGSS